MESITRNVSEIQASDKAWLETFLGQRLDEQHQVFIMVYSPNVLPDEDVRRAAAERMERTFQRTDAHARDFGVTAEEADAAVEEAVNRVRRSE